MTETQAIAEAPEGAVAHTEALAALFAKVRQGIGQVIFGQDHVVDETLVTLLAGGHGLLIGVPGLAKTRLVETLGIVLGKFVAFVLFMFLVGARLLRWLLERVAATNSRELFTLAVVVAAIGIGFGAAELFGLSFALGAFVAAVVVGESDHSHRAATELQPLQDAFAALFFVAMGMLFDPAILVREPLRVLVVVAIIVLGKFVATFLIVRLLRHPAGTALIIAASLAQIGEFSFILAEVGVTLRLLPAEGQSLIVAGALLSIALNSFLLYVAKAIQSRVASPVSA